MQKLKFTTELVRKSWIVRVGGFVDASNVTDLRERLMDAADQAGHVLLLDLSAVSAMDSSGVAVLIELHHRLFSEGRVLAIVGESTPVKRIIELLHAQNAVCDVYKDLREGIRRTRNLKPEVLT